MTKIHMLLPLVKWVEFPHLKPRRRHPAGMVARAEDLERFWQKVNKEGPLPDPERYPHVSSRCWIWTAAHAPAGYGKFMFLHTLMQATHFCMYAHGREIPSGMEVCHHCDNPPCVNPDHIFAGTRSENIYDCIQRGRFSQANHWKVRRPKRGYGSGELSHSHKLKDHQVLEIIASQENTKLLALRFGVCRSTIQKTKAGKRGLTKMEIK